MPDTSVIMPPPGVGKGKGKGTPPTTAPSTASSTSSVARQIFSEAKKEGNPRKPGGGAGAEKKVTETTKYGVCWSVWKGPDLRGLYTWAFSRVPWYEEP